MKFKEKKPEKTIIRAGASKRSGEEYPAFSLRYLSPKWCITGCNQEGKAAFADKVRILTQKSWMEILNLPKKGQGFEKIPRDQIKAPIPPHVTEDVTHFWAFRFHGKAPMVGYKSNEIFHVLWFDPDFELYDHGS
ncbi:MAG: hypothetical protein K9J42_05700 [Sulfuritalea sp.]|nr:hypothetical protein [Sulfuritalea sp.]